MLNRREMILAAGALAAPAVALGRARPDATSALEDALARIEAIDRAGPMINAVVSLDPSARDQAARIDRANAPTLLRGLPILVKDNIDVAGMATTIGSLALIANVAVRDADAIARLRAAGAVIVGKANLSEWANIRGAPSIGGWSAVGGLTRNPHVLDRTADGSSSGSAAAVAAGIVAVAIGTETDGSIVDPASLNGVVGMKPSFGLIPTSGVAPVAASQDTLGALSRDVRGLASILSIMAGRDLTRDVGAGSLRGKRIGVARWTPVDAKVAALFANACAALEALGAVLVELDGFRPADHLGDDELLVLLTELRAGTDAYLAGRSADIPVRSLSDVVEFNRRHPAELALFGQSLFEAALTLGTPSGESYRQARARMIEAADTNGLRMEFAKHRLDLLVGPSNGPAPVIDPAFAASKNSRSLSQLPAIAGWPHLTVPMGFVTRLPIGLSFIAPRGQDAAVIGAGHAYEQATRLMRPPAFLPTLLADPAIADGLRGRPHR